MPATIYAMTGTIGAGKTTFAKKLAQDKKSVALLIDHYIRLLGPVHSREDYDKSYYGVRNVIADCASQLLILGHPVVLDFGGSVGHWEWLSAIADRAKANIEIFHLIAPIEVRRQRVQKRNLNPEEFKFSDEEFEAMP